MSEISILDLQNLRHLIGGYSTTHCKMTDYASQTQDPEAEKAVSGRSGFCHEKQTGTDEISVGRTLSAEFPDTENHVKNM